MAKFNINKIFLSFKVEKIKANEIHAKSDAIIKKSFLKKYEKSVKTNETKIKIPDNFSLIISIYLPKNKRELYTN